MRQTQALSIKLVEEGGKKREQFIKTCKTSRAIELWMVLISIKSEFYRQKPGRDGLKNGLKKKNTRHKKPHRLSNGRIIIRRNGKYHWKFITGSRLLSHHRNGIQFEIKEFFGIHFQINQRNQFGN